MNDIIKEEKIENMIYEIRGKQVMLDSDLARLYECSNGTKTINQAVKRHINKFPERYMFQLDKEEYLNLKSQFGTSSLNNYGGVRKLPFVFTEQGVAMLSSVLNSEAAIEINISIMRAFVTVRQYLSSVNSTTKEIEELKQRMKMLEEAIEDTFASVNDLS